MPQVPEVTRTRHAMQNLLRHPRFAATVVAALLATAGVVQLRLGVESTPDPLRELLQALTGHDAGVTSRLLIAIEFGLAAAVLACGNRFLAVFASATAAFVALACVSRAVRAGGLGWPLVSLAISVALLWLAARTTPRAPSHGRRGLSPAWTALLAIVAGTVAAQWTSAAGFTQPPAKSGPAIRSIDLDMKPYVGRMFDDTPLMAYMPTLREFVEKGTAFVVFYNPACETCHTLFEEHFLVPRPETVVAVEIPLGVDAVSAAREAPRPIECFDCVRLSLEPGPNWVVASPMTLKFEDGKLVCAADRFGGDCLTVERN